MRNRWYSDFSGEDLHIQLMNAENLQECIHLISAFLRTKFRVNRHVSERQKTVGVTPRFYIWFHEAIRLMETGEYERLSDVLML